MISASFFRKTGGAGLTPRDVAPVPWYVGTAQSVLRALWLLASPALLAGVIVKDLVPPTRPSLPAPLDALVRFGRASPVLLGVGLFVLLSAMARHWLHQLQGGRYLAARPIAGGRWRNGIGAALWIAVAAATAWLIRARLIQPYDILSASMLPMLEPGDEILGIKGAYGSGAAVRAPRRGDVILFRSAEAPMGVPDAPQVLVKRVIGIPGDRIRMQGGVPVINGWVVPTCDVGAYVYPLSDGQGGALQGRLLLEFLEDRVYLTVHPATKAFREEYEVKASEVFVLGDNRSNSFDSRAWNEGHGGGVPLSAIESRAQWFLVGKHLDGRADWGRLLRRLDDVATRLHVEAFDRRLLDEGIEKCLKQAPKETRPPVSSASMGSATAATEGAAQ